MGLVDRVVIITYPHIIMGSMLLGELWVLVKTHTCGTFLRATHDIWLLMSPVWQNWV